MDRVLLELAKESIRQNLEGISTINVKYFKGKYPQLLKKGACFVTLVLDGELRGCIGTLIAHRPLIEDVLHNAKAAAFEDVRFPPLSKEEFQRVQIEISILSTPHFVEYDSIEELKNKISPHLDGVILQEGRRKATFLPQVWEQLPTFELFFSHLCQKAGLNNKCLTNHPDIWTYNVKKIK